jgi:hypothetical protein
VSARAVFELQLLCLTNIRGVTPSARAAGADWVTLEGVMAAVQSGWISVANMRVLKLLSRGDKGAPKALASACAAAIRHVHRPNIAP